MPSSTIDTFLASSIMIILTMSAMIGTSKVITPYLTDLAHRDDSERFQQLAQSLLLSTGTPADWGKAGDTKPTSLGFARVNSPEPYELDIDKVSRLNSENTYSLTYPDLWETLGVRDVSFQIEIKTLFDVSINLISSSVVENQTVYEFEVATKKTGIPVEAHLSGYAVIENFVDRQTSSTSSNGAGTLAFGVPNSLNGTGLLLVFASAKANLQIVSCNVYAFSHNSSSPIPNGTFTSRSPLNHVLNVSLSYSATEIVKAQVFTFNYNFSLVQKAQTDQSAEYFIPSLLDSSPMILMLTGRNGSTSFAEWISYPQLPLTIGANFIESTAGTKIVSMTNIVTVNSAIYEVVTRWGGLG